MSVLSFLTDLASSAVLSGTEQQSINTSVSTLQSRLGLLADEVVCSMREGMSKWRESHRRAP
jgi:hypothetical protein